MVICNNFTRVMKGEQDDITVTLQSHVKNKIEENKKKLIPIIKTIILLGAQNIPLRGHRDDGALGSDESCFGEGNFRALLKFRVEAGDNALEHHMNTCGRNATYISKTTKNEIIQCCGDVITTQIVEKFKKKSGFFTIITDETTDVATQKQLFDILTSIEIQERFLLLVTVEDLTGESFAC